MLVNADLRALEWRAVVHLSNDHAGIAEILNGVDQHSENQRRFNLPSRLIAKKFLFRNIYCPLNIADRTAYAYSKDPEFKGSGGVKFWQGVIEAFYEKYAGINAYHQSLIREVAIHGFLTSETGRIYPFSPVKRREGEELPFSDIANYPVQGFSADLMQIVRVSAHNRLKDRVLFVNTVHDSLVLDYDGDVRGAVEICKELKRVCEDVPKNFLKIYGKELRVPMDCDCHIGINWKWAHEIKFDK